MPRSKSFERVLILTLELEQAAAQGEWSLVEDLLQQRSTALDGISLSAREASEINRADERILDSIRALQNEVRAEMRHLGTALRLASSSPAAPQGRTLQLAS